MTKSKIKTTGTVGLCIDLNSKTLVLPHLPVILFTYTTQPFYSIFLETFLPAMNLTTYGKN
jgi:hypothetical protein